MKTSIINEKVNEVLNELLTKIYKDEKIPMGDFSHEQCAKWEKLIEDISEVIEERIDEDTPLFCESEEQYEDLIREAKQGLHQDNSKAELIDILFKKLSPDQQHEIIEDFFGKIIEKSY